jgi:activating signal cointegrator complex subunit 2
VPVTWWLAVIVWESDWVVGQLFGGWKHEILAFNFGVISREIHVDSEYGNRDTAFGQRLVIGEEGEVIIKSWQDLAGNSAHFKMKSLPQFAPYPEANLRLEIAPTEWLSYLDAWIQLGQAYLGIPDEKFLNLVAGKESSLVAFVISYVEATSESPSSPQTDTTRAHNLHKVVFILCRRLLQTPKLNPYLLQWSFLSRFAHIFHRVQNATTLLDQVWKFHSKTIEKSLEGLKEQIVKYTSNISQISESLVANLRLITRLVQLSPPVGNYLSSGSDLIDSLISAFPTSSFNAQSVITIFTYHLLLAPTKLSPPNFSVLSNHIYTLKSNATELQQTHQSSILASLVSNTDLVTKLNKMSEASDSDESQPKPSQNLSMGLLAFRTASSRQKKKDKFKGTAANDDVDEAMHIHRMSLIFQVQDLFPDFGSGFIAKLLDAYSESVEEVTETF